MKKQLFFAMLITLSLVSCKDDESSQITFSLKNMTSFIDKSPEYIKNASPGVIYKDLDDYLAFDIENTTKGISESTIRYNFVSARCVYISVVPKSYTFATLMRLMELTDKEFGTAQFYFLEYKQNSIVKNFLFNTLAEFKAYIVENSITVNQINLVNTSYKYGDYEIASGGNVVDSYFQPWIYIGLYKNAAKAGNHVLPVKK